MASERRITSPAQTAVRSSANNTPNGGISRPAVITPPITARPGSGTLIPVQMKGEQLTFTEMSIHSPGNSNTIAEVTLDGRSLPQKWKNDGGKHGEKKIVEDLESTYLEQLKAAKVMSLIINRAPCGDCAQALVDLKTKYNIAIRVKSTIITQDGEKGLAILNANNIPFRLFTIDQREALSTNTRADKRKWARSKKVLTEQDRVKGIGNTRDLITATKNLSTDRGRRTEERVNIAKAKKAGYANPTLTWKELGQGRAALARAVEQQQTQDIPNTDMEVSEGAPSTDMEVQAPIPPAVSAAEQALTFCKKLDWDALIDGRANMNNLTQTLHQLIIRVQQALPHYPVELAKRASGSLSFLMLCTQDEHTTMNNLAVIPEYIGQVCVALGVD